MTTIASSTPKLQVEVANGVASLLIDNAARRNAFDSSMWRALPGIARQVDAAEDIRVLVIRGAPTLSFCSGADISEFSTLRTTAKDGLAYEQSNVEAFEALSRLSKPTIAAISGYCIGGGMGLAAACDLRIAASDSVFSIPAGRLGVGYPPSAMKFVVAAVGAQTAMDLFFTARRINADDAKSCGFVSRVLPVKSFHESVLKIAQEIAGNAPLTLRAAKAAIASAAGLPGAQTPEQCAALAAVCFDSADYAEGRAAFLEKRQPNFSGR
jgi:enoyl-CoA hydratase/carnithine racemase